MPFAPGTTSSVDDVFPVLENRRRQTGGVRLRSSGDAVFDPYVVSVGHPGDSRRPLPLAACVERLVYEAVGELVVLATHGGVGDTMDLARYARRVEEEVLERLVLHAVLAAHLLDEELRVGDDLELVDTRLDRAFESGDQGRILRDVVRRNADRLASRIEHGSVFGLEHEAVRGRPRVASGAPVGEEFRLHASTSAYTSYAGSS